MRVWEKSDLLGLGIVLSKELNGLAPRSFLSAIEFAQIEHVALNHPVTRYPAVLNHTPVKMLFAILAALFAAEEHSSSNHSGESSRKGVGRHYKPFWRWSAPRKRVHEL